MEDSLKLLTNYLQDVLEQPDTAALRLEDLAPDFRELGEMKPDALIISDPGSNGQYPGHG